MKSSGIAARLFSGVALMLCAATALPQSTGLYTVELVVFRNDGTIGALPDASSPPAAGDDGIEVTPAAVSKLNAAAGKLKKGGYTVLGHIAWTQSPTVWNSRRGVSPMQVGLGSGIDGKISVERSSTYPLNLRLDLTITEGGHRYRLNEVRRNVKAGQIYYFDRPAVGVLAIITPAAAAAAPATAG